MSDENLNRLFMVIAIALMMLIAVMVTGSHAKGGPREGNSPEISEWFRSQHNSLGGCCCNDADGHRYYGHYVLNSDGSVTISPAPRTPTRSSPTRCYPAQTRLAPRCGGTTRDNFSTKPSQIACLAGLVRLRAGAARQGREQHGRSLPAIAVT